MNKTTLIAVTVILVVLITFIFVGGSAKSGTSNFSEENSLIKDGVQYVTINVGAGYSPKISQAKAGIPTRLVMKTDGAYDCSSSLVIRSVNFQKILPQTGKTEIDIGVPKAGVPLEGVCSMGMYSFLVNFI